MPLRVGILLAAFAALVVVAPAVAGELPPGGTFADDNGNVHEADIEAVAAAGITKGCNPPANDKYCPDGLVTRAQIAAFLVRALDLSPSGDDYFFDDNGSIFENDINSLAASKITFGCNPPSSDKFCPDANLTRAQMAALLVRAYGYTDQGGGDLFVDDDGSIFEADIDKLGTAGVTLGCNPPANDRFCPGSFVRRDAMASFLTRAGGLEPMPPPPPATCPVLPDDNIWNRKVTDVPTHALSDDYIASIGADATFHADFGSGVWPPGSTSPIGIPFVEVNDAPLVSITFTAYGDESDPGPYPVPPNAPVEGGPDGTGDRHVIVIDNADCTLYELFDAWPQPNGSWNASSGAVFDLTSNELRPDGWTSADAAGLPIYPGLVRYDEVADGEIRHAIRFTAPSTQKAYVWPARHFASSITDQSYPPMGQRFRLDAAYDISGFSPEVQVILTAMKDYGLVLADNGSPWFISGAPDERWDNDVLHELDVLRGSDFEAVDVSSLMIDPDSGAALP